MHNHDNHKENSWMMWAMLLCCLGPVFLVLFFGAGVTAGGISPWIVIGAVAVVAILHFVMMKRSHKHTQEQSHESGNKDEHSGHGCCH